MAERARPKAWRRVLLVAAVVCTACFSNADYDDEIDTTTTRYIDTICAENTYKLEGSARRTTGLTDDSCGFALGPEPGRVVFDSLGGGYDETDIAVLVRAPDGSFSWEALKPDTTSSSYSFAARDVPLAIVDVRIHTVVSSPADCSIARYPRRRKLG